MSDIPINSYTNRLVRVFLGTCSTLILLDVVLLSLRLNDRISKLKKLRADDWLLVAAFVSC